MIYSKITEVYYDCVADMRNAEATFEQRSADKAIIDAHIQKMDLDFEGIQELIDDYVNTYFDYDDAWDEFYGVTTAEFEDEEALFYFLKGSINQVID